MDILKIGNKEIPYNIEVKKNKNTYFYFKPEGYIQINLSRYQSKKDAINYMKKNSATFLKKLENVRTAPNRPTSEFWVKGKVYNIIELSNNSIEFDEEENLVYLPTSDIKHPVIKAFYKTEMHKQIEDLKEKYKNNPYVNIVNVNYKTRYTTSRHGSCNARKRNINLNLYLIQFDPIYIEYVFCHEIAHLVHQNHSKDFYSLLGKLFPNYKEVRNDLRRNYR